MKRSRTLNIEPFREGTFSRRSEASEVMIMNECEGEIKMMRLQNAKLRTLFKVKFGVRARLGAVCFPGNLTGNGYF